ncbi:Aldehyde/histidinol dehydrogenase [Infundibulicybe gibba]|nr:Aldehyde/histidinol dehydrogenase [Infundibulicybe gibba]
MEAYFAEVGVIVNDALKVRLKSRNGLGRTTGTVLIIAPWNYPMILGLQPLYGAISAGCYTVTSRPIGWSKTLSPKSPEFLNYSGTTYSYIGNGKICVCPDFVIINRGKQEEFIAALKKHHADFFPNGALKSDSFSRIVSDFHFSRLKNLLARSKGTIVIGGGTDEKTRGLEPAVVKGVLDGDSLLSEELFGPILPLVAVDSVDDAIEFISSRDHPLVLYAFTSDEKTKIKIRENTMSGNLVFNDTFQQLAIHELPFGGVGESGYGRQVLKYSYDNFTYERSTLDIPKESELFLEPRYPPYTPEKLEFMSVPINLAIPPSKYPDTSPNGHARM